MSYELAIGQTTSARTHTVSTETFAASGNDARVEAATTRMLGSIPASQAYYWSHKWQSGEEESVKELAAGAGRVFSSGREAIEWLLADED